MSSSISLSLLLLRISFPSPILCYTSDVRALSEWVWWWRFLPQCIVGNVRVSLHCCKYGVWVLQSEPRRIFQGWFGDKNPSHLVSLVFFYQMTWVWVKSVEHSWWLRYLFISNDHVRGGGVCRVTRMLGMCSRHVLEVDVGLCCPLQAEEWHWSSRGAHSCDGVTSLPSAERDLVPTVLCNLRFK